MKGGAAPASCWYALEKGGDVLSKLRRRDEEGRGDCWGRWRGLAPSEATFSDSRSGVLGSAWKEEAGQGAALIIFTERFCMLGRNILNAASLFKNENEFCKIS